MSLVNRRQIIATALAIGVLAPDLASAQAFPSRPVTVVSTFAPGSPQDLLLRAIAELAAVDLKQPVVVETKPGAAGALVLGHLIAQKPDGYTVGATTSAAMTLAPQMQKLAFDTAKDFDYLMQMVSFPIGVVVKAESPFKTWADLVTYAKANPGKLTYGTPGTPSIANLGMQRLQALAGISLTHVPHKGAMEIIPAVLGDHVSLMVTGTEWKPQVDAGRMRQLIMWTDKRLPAFPDVLTAREAGYPFELDVSICLVAPKGLNPAVSAQLQGTFKKALEAPSVRALIEKYNMVPAYLDGPAFKARMAVISADMKPVIEKLGLHAK